MTAETPDPVELARPICPSTPHGMTLDARAVALWRTQQFDTVEIATRIGLTEPQVCQAIAAARPVR